MRVAVLAAGVSSRLFPHTADRHKLMMPVGERWLLDFQVRMFVAAGVDTLTYVLGHGATSLSKGLKQHDGAATIRTLFNSHYRTHNLDRSALLALSAAEGPVLYWEGDTFADPAIVRDLIDPEIVEEVVIAYDPASTSTRPDTFVVLDKGGAISLRFTEHAAPTVDPPLGSVGEFICAVRFGDASRRYVVERLRCASHLGSMQLYSILEDVFQRFPTKAIPSGGAAWVEVDNWDDYLRATKILLGLGDTVDLS